MSGGDVVCSGWLIKSPPEKKLKRYAWKKRWFVLRSGRLTGDPDVLEYYKNDHAKKPIRVIDLNLCEQVDAGLTFNKKELEHSFIFDIKTIDRIFYLVADTEDEMNKWVRCICDICGFNPTDEDGGKPQVAGAMVMDSLSHSAPGDTEPSPMSGVPPPYHPVSVRHLESSSSQEETPDYLLLINCESKKPGSSRLHAGSCRSMSSETDCNDNLPSHRPVSSAPKHSSPNGFFPQRSTYECPQPRSADAAAASTTVSLLPRSFSQDTVLQPRAASSPRKASVESQMRHFSISYDVPPTPGSGGGGGITYQVPRTSSASESDVPPPRPPKPSVAVPPERSPTDSFYIPRSVSESDGNYIVPTGAVGGKGLRSNTLGTVEPSVLRKDFGSQECYDVPRAFSADRSNSFELNESFNNYLKNKGMVPVGGGSTEDMDTYYVPMGGSSPSHHRSGSLVDAPQEPSYVPMTPGGSDFPSLGKQVPPPVHMGFRCSPKTPPRRAVAFGDCQPPPVDRNLKPDRKGRPPKLDIKPTQEWEELPAPVHSPVTRSFARDFTRFPMPPRPPSVHSVTSSTDSEDCEENYVPMTSSSATADEPTLKLGAHANADGGSPMVKPKRDKQVEYLDLDLDPGKSTPPRKKKSNGTGGSISDERVDYVVVDQHRTQALKNTKEAWNDGRQSTETDVPPKGPK